jgi:hypothetical protein
MELGIISLSDLQRDPATCRQIEPWQRLTHTVGYAELADTLGLDVRRRHHSADFAVPA